MFDYFTISYDGWTLNGVAGDYEYFNDEYSPTDLIVDYVVHPVPLPAPEFGEMCIVKSPIEGYAVLVEGMLALGGYPVNDLVTVCYTYNVLRKIAGTHQITGELTYSPKTGWHIYFHIPQYHGEDYDLRLNIDFPPTDEGREFVADVAGIFLSETLVLDGHFYRELDKYRNVS